MSRSMRIDVVATVVSVGPYVFHTSAPGKRSRSRTATSGGSASPQKRNRRTAGSIPAAKLRSARHMAANDGVDTHVVTADARSEQIGRASCRERGEISGGAV